jgi:UDPglucose--hexose-1-phosphate uridylyltransferase
MLNSPHRLQRPWQGQVETPDESDLPEYDHDCYLCPGNTRANNNANPDYAGAFVFENDFPALTTSSIVEDAPHPLMQVRPDSGYCRVIVYTERHDLRLATMSTDQVGVALHAMFREFAELDSRPDVGWVQVFENRGRMMGCSNEHPHAQVWATSSLPTEAAKELDSQSAYLAENGSVLLMDYVEAELEEQSRLIFQNEHIVVVVPFWAAWPYETIIIPRRQVAGPEELTEQEIEGLAESLRMTLSAYDRLFSTSAPYSMGMHARPSDGKPHPEWQLHFHIYPPLLRSATVRKHFVGFELLSMPQRDLTPEVAAEALRTIIEEHR